MKTYLLSCMDVRDYIPVYCQKEFFPWGQAHREATPKLLKIGCETAIRHQRPGMNHSMSISLYRSHELQGSKELGTELVRQTPWASISIALCCQEHQLVDQMFHRAFVDKKFSVVFSMGQATFRKLLMLKSSSLLLSYRCLNRGHSTSKFPFNPSCL